MNLFNKLKRKLCWFYRPRGQAMTELAIIFPLLIVFFLAAAEFSNILMTALRVSNLSREIANAGFRDCAALTGTNADTCLQNISQKVMDGAKLLIKDFDDHGTLITTIYAQQAGQSALVLISRVTIGSGSFSSRYNTGNVNSSIVANNGTIVVGEAVINYTPLTAIKNFLELLSLPANIYEVTIF
ncbi:MAG: hypothetical protein A3C35_06770 [Omnitrophica bacterium RIFCSPHIGHO2_02_FULL_46_11]|nr:MAG: hypothetical protein A3C35_06770 [Omnitrophica bacterium RIFCSPHIGHO2_02_FULL_46_11]OGW86735.1 MAG: hypothetical protein A3A81_08670 [Omnitrophica bacterium RIFCSPLOWO2_01_FULL_45_10b]